MPGSTIDQTLAHIRVDAAGRVDQDLSCIKCGYNLRTLSLEEGRCPECGQAVGRSAVGNYLRYCDPDWLRKTWWGTNRFGVAVVMFAALYVASEAGVSLSLRVRGEAEWAMLTVYVVWVSTAIALLLAGFWRSTTPDPAGGQVSVLWARRIARWSAGMALVAFVVATIRASHQPFEGARWVFLPAATIAFTIAALLMHGAALARRIPNWGLAWFSYINVLGFAALSLPTLMLGANPWYWQYAFVDWYDDWITSNLLSSQPNLLYAFLEPYLPYDSWDLLDRAWSTLGWAWLGFLAMAIVLLVWFWRALKTQADLARASWAGPPRGDTIG